MALRQDYILRMIDNMAKLLAQLILKKAEPEYRLPDSEADYTETDKVYARVLALADAGEVNDAENELLEYVDGMDADRLEMGLSFYLYLGQMDGDFLDEHNYSKEEIKDGLEILARTYGVSGIVSE